MLPAPDGPATYNRAGNPIANDLLVVYGAGRMALEGRAADAYDLEALSAVQRAVAGGPVGGLPWPYPPTFLLAAAPLAALPWPAAIALWSLLNVGALALVARLWLRRARALSAGAAAGAGLLAALLFPAAAHSLMAGQNGALFAALLGGGLLALERRPVLAGLLFALAAAKPQLGLLLPLALLAGGHVRAFVAAAVGVLALAAAALALFGAEAWPGFFEALGAAGGHAASGTAPPEKMVTVLAAATLAGAPSSLAWLLQAGAIFGVAIWVWRLWRSPRPLPDKACLLLLLSPLATPYAFYTDMAVLLLPALWLLCRRPATNGRTGLAAALWFGSGGLFALGLLAGWQLWPIALLLAALAWPATQETATDGRDRCN